MSGLRAAAALLTRVPVSTAAPDERAMARSVPWIPVVGALVGLAVAGVYAAALTVMPALLAAAIGVGAGVAATGALHEDGLADVADGFGGGRTREEVLRIMKDPAHGTFGVLAIAFSILLRVGAVSALGGWSALAVIPTAHALSRAASLVVSASTPAAAHSGLGASFSPITTRDRVVVSCATGLAVSALALGVWAFPAAAIAGAGAALVAVVALRRIGGSTGDVLGAAQQMAEILVLLMAAAAVTRGVDLTWWR